MKDCSDGLFPSWVDFSLFGTGYGRLLTAPIHHLFIVLSPHELPLAVTLLNQVEIGSILTTPATQ